MRKVLLKLVIISLVLSFCGRSWALWNKEIYQVEGDRRDPILLSSLSLDNYTGNMQVCGRVSSAERLNYVSCVALSPKGDFLEGRSFKLMINGTDASFVGSPEVLYRDGRSFVFVRYRQGELYTPALVSFDTNGSYKVTYLDKPLKTNGVYMSISTTDNLYTLSMKKLIPTDDGFYLIVSASVKEDCGVKGFYVAKFDYNLNPVWHKFYGLAYRKTVCVGRTGDSCDNYENYFPVTCFVSIPNVELTSAAVDYEGGLVLAGNTIVPSYPGLQDKHLSSYGAFIWKLGSDGRVDKFVYFLVPEGYSIYFSKIMYHNNNIFILGNLKEPEGYRVFLMILKADSLEVVKTMVSRDVTSYPSRIIGAAVGKFGLAFSFLYKVGGNPFSIVVVDVNEFREKFWYYGYTWLPRAFEIVEAPKQGGIIYGLVGTTLNNYVVASGIYGDACNADIVSSQDKFFIDPYIIPVNVIEYEDLPKPPVSQDIVDWDLEIYEFSEGNYLYGTVSVCQECAFSVDSPCDSGWPDASTLGISSDNSYAFVGQKLNFYCRLFGERSNGDFEFYIDYGDGSSESGHTGAFSHIYNSTGLYKVVCKVRLEGDAELSDVIYIPVGNLEAPIADVKANGVDGIVSIKGQRFLTISGYVDPGEYQGSVEVWLAVVLPDGNVLFLSGDGVTFEPVPFYTGSLGGKGLFYDEIARIPTDEVPDGVYRIYFAIDTIPNGIIDFSGISYDVVEVVKY